MRIEQAAGEIIVVLKKLLDEILNKLVSHVVEFVWGALIVGGVTFVWSLAPDRYSFTVTKVQIVVGVSVFLGILASACWITRHFSRREKSQKVAPIDDTQRDILRMMWSVEGGYIEFRKLQVILGNHPTEVMLACQRLQRRGFVACNPNDIGTAVQLLDEGREFASKEGLTNAEEILIEAEKRIEQLNSGSSKRMYK